MGLPGSGVNSSDWLRQRHWRSGGIATARLCNILAVSAAHRPAEPRSGGCKAEAFRRIAAALMRGNPEGAGSHALRRRRSLIGIAQGLHSPAELRYGKLAALPLKSRGPVFKKPC